MGVAGFAQGFKFPNASGGSLVHHPVRNSGFDMVCCFFFWSLEQGVAMAVPKLIWFAKIWRLPVEMNTMLPFPLWRANCWLRGRRGRKFWDCRVVDPQMVDVLVNLDP